MLFRSQFNQTNNKTLDFSSTLNTALNGGLCDCNGCSLSGDNCNINFTFHSDTAGILEYSALDIDWTESTNPNLTINQPIGAKTSKTVSYIVNATDNYQTDYCSYWVTRGASLEIANTSVTCSDSVTGDFVVSGDASYIFHFFVNDTSGNSNTTSSNFSVDTSTSGTILGGGGGSTVVVQADSGWIMQVSKGITSYEISMPSGTSRKLNLQFENIGETEKTITFSCVDKEGVICKYVTFDEESFILPV